MERLKLIAGYAVLTMWIVSTGLSMIDRTYNPPSSVPLALAALSTLLFGDKLLGRFGNGKS